MKETSDLEKAIVASRTFESVLTERYRAWGNGLGGKTRTVSKNLRDDVVQNLRYVSRISNLMRHEKVDKFPDRERFEKACKELETFFKEAIVPDVPGQPSWLEPCPIGLFPRTLYSSLEKRLYCINTGKVTVYPTGTYRLGPVWPAPISGLVEAGYVCMLPLPMPGFAISPVRSKDDLELRLSLELSAAVEDDDESIAAIILTEGQQLEIVEREVLLVVQRICAEMEYAHITKSLHEIAEAVKRDFNAKVSGGYGGAFLIESCAVVECALEDVEIEETKRQQRRASEDAKKKAQEQRQSAELEALQAQVAKERGIRECDYALLVQNHEIEIQRLRADAEAEQQRLERELLNENAVLQAKLALAASQQSIEIQNNTAEAEMKGIPVAKAKAAIYSSPGGPEILNQHGTFELKALEVRKQIELLRAIFTDARIKEFMQFARNSSITEAQVASLSDYKRLLEASLGAPETKINVSQADKKGEPPDAGGAP